MVQIRLATENDLPMLGGIYTRAYNSLQIGEQWTDETATILLKHFYKEQLDLFFVATDHSSLVGAIVAFVKPWWDGNHLTDGELFVDPSFQKKGVGKQLIGHLFNESVKKYQAVSWDTFTHRIHEHPLKWYKSLGFEEIAHWVMITGDIKKVLKILEKSNIV